MKHNIGDDRNPWRDAYIMLSWADAGTGKLSDAVIVPVTGLTVVKMVQLVNDIDNAYVLLDSPSLCFMPPVSLSTLVDPGKGFADYDEKCEKGHTSVLSDNDVLVKVSIVAGGDAGSSLQEVVLPKPDKSQLDFLLSR